MIRKALNTGRPLNTIVLTCGPRALDNPGACALGARFQRY